MEDQPGQQSSPYSQYPQYQAPADPYAAAQPPYPTPPQPPYAPPGQPSYSNPSHPPYMAPGQPPYAPQPTYPQSGYPPQPYPYGPGPNYPQPRKPKNYLWLIIVAAVLVVVIFGAVIAVVNNGKSNSPIASGQPTAPITGATAPATSVPTQASQPTPTTAPTQPSSSSSGSHKIGDVVTIDNWQVVVNGAKVTHGGQYDTPQHAGDVYLEIDVSVTNQTGQSQTFSSDLGFTLKDSTGQKYIETITSDAPSSPDGTVSSGSKLRGTAVYEVPATMHAFEFDVAPDPFGTNDVAVWNLSV